MTLDEAISSLRRQHAIGRGYFQEGRQFVVIDGVAMSASDAINLATGRVSLLAIAKQRSGSAVGYDADKFMRVVARAPAGWTIVLIERGVGILAQDSESIAGLVKAKACAMLEAVADRGSGAACVSADWFQPSRPLEG